MATHLAGLGTLRYDVSSGNYVSFPGDSSVRVTSRQVKSNDGRNIKYVEHSITVEGWLFAADLASSSGTVDDAFSAVKRILSQAGGRLTFTGKGWGDLSVNTGSSVARDVVFGPFPEVVEWEPFGNITCKFTWQVKLTLPWNPAVYAVGGVLDYSWEVDYSYDSEGFASRTITGSLEITGTRFGQSALVSDVSHIEQFYGRIIKVDCPLGMRRVSQQFRIDASKTKVNFTFVDEPMKGFILPPGIVDMDIIHEMSSQNGDSTLSTWVWVFNARATPDAATHQAAAYQACIAAHHQRFNYMIARAISHTGNIMPLPIAFKVVENVKKRETSITIAWGLRAAGGSGSNTYTPIDILARSGLWQPFKWNANDYKNYADRIYGPNQTGAFSQMMSDPFQNVILDISAVAPYVPNPGKALGNFNIPQVPNSQNGILAPYGQYLEFKCWVAVLQAGNVWTNYPLRKNSDINTGAINTFALQEISGKYNKYKLRGYIVRVGIPPSGIPTVKRIGNVPVKIPAGENIRSTTEPVYNTMGLIIWRTEFEIPLVPDYADNSDVIKQPKAGTGNNNKPQGSQQMKIKDDAVTKPVNELEFYQKLFGL